jgi:hypothetical protein
MNDEKITVLSPGDEGYEEAVIAYLLNTWGIDDGKRVYERLGNEAGSESGAPQG